MKVNKKAFYVTCDNYVTMEDGTGIVHIAPAFGQDDANIGKNIIYHILIQLEKMDVILKDFGRVEMSLMLI